MKLFNKLMTVLMAFVMMFGMSAAKVSATDQPVADTTPHSITIKNTNTSITINGKQYSAYKLFDSTHSGTAYSYTMATDNQFYSADLTATTAPAEGTLAALLRTYFTFEAISGDTTKVNVTPKTGFDAAKARELADKIQPFLTGKTPTATSPAAAGETATITLPAGAAGQGYYIVTGDAAPKDPNSTETVVSAVMITNEDPSPQIQPKAGIPTLDKQITATHLLDDKGKAATEQVGKFLNFMLTSKVPDLTGYSDYTFIISDTLSNGLTFQGTNDDPKVTVTVNGTNETANAQIVINGQTLTVTLPFDLLSDYHAGEEIRVEYNAMVNKNALTTNYEKNTAELEYSHSPYDDTTNKTPKKEVHVIDVNIDVNKVDKEKGTPLPEAKFKLFKGETTPADTALAWYKWNATTNKVEWVAKAQADEFKTNAQGKLETQFRGLEAETAGTKYGLLETKAPEGYNPLKDPVIITLTSTYSEGEGENAKPTVTVTADKGTVTNGSVDLSADQNQNQPVDTVTVENQSGQELPSTGGMGTYLFYGVGSVLVLGAAVLLIARRKMSNE